MPSMIGTGKEGECIMKEIERRKLHEGRVDVD